MLVLEFKRLIRLKILWQINLTNESIFESPDEGITIGMTLFL